MIKEQGYDAFLAEQIAKGQADIRAGRVYSLEEAKERSKEALVKKIKEIEKEDLAEMTVSYG